MSTDTELSASRAALEAAQANCEREGVNYTYMATEDGGEEEMILAANRCGLLRLASLLVELAERPGSHLHLDAASELDACWKGVIVSHVEDPW